MIHERPAADVAKLECSSDMTKGTKSVDTHSYTYSNPHLNKKNPAAVIVAVKT